MDLAEFGVGKRAATNDAQEQTSAPQFGGHPRERRTPSKRGASAKQFWRSLGAATIFTLLPSSRAARPVSPLLGPLPLAPGHARRPLYFLQPLSALASELGEPGFIGNVSTDSCDNSAGAPQLYSLGRDYWQKQPASVRAIFVGQAWRNACTASKATVPVSLTYTFVDPAREVPSETGGATLAPYQEELRAEVSAFLAELSSVALVDFVEVGAADPPAWLRLRNDQSLEFPGDDLRVDDRGYPIVSIKPFTSYSTNLDVVGISQLTAPVPRRAILSALGACPPGSECLTDGVRLPQDGFTDTFDSTALSRGETCALGLSFSDPTYGLGGLGPLDWSVVVAAYGIREQPPQNGRQLLTSGPGRSGLMDPAGNNTLAVNTTRHAVLSLRPDGRAVSRVGEALYAAAPLSSYTVADLQLSQGGIMLGNAADNLFIGGREDNLVDVGGGRNEVRLGSGNGTVVVRSQTVAVNISGFVPGRDRIAAIGLRGVPRVASRPSAEGVQTIALSYPSGPQIEMHGPGNVTFDLRRDLTTADPVPSLTFCQAADDSRFAPLYFEGSYPPYEESTGRSGHTVDGPMIGMIVGIVAAVVGLAGAAIWQERRKRLHRLARLNRPGG